MGLKNTAYRYGAVAKALHWLVFVMVAGLIAAGFVMTGMDNTPDKFRLYALHKSTGILLLAVVVARLLWKAVNVQPALPPSLSRAEKMLARAGHAALYLLLLAMPLSGWLMSSSAGLSVSVYGWFTLPDLIGPMPERKADFREAHEAGAWLMIVLVSLHVLAAMLHHFHHRNAVLRRMLPFTGDITDDEIRSVLPSDTHPGR